MKRTAIALVALAVSTTSPAAWAAAPKRGGPARPAPDTGLHVASGQPARLLRRTTRDVPSRARAAWEAFRAERGDTFTAYFDEATGVPGRVYGGFVDAPGSMRSAAVAERVAREVLARHVDLFAPGAKAADLRLVANSLDGDQRSVAFLQTKDGLPVVGGQVSFRFKRDHLFMIGSEALPDVVVEGLRTPVSAETAAKAAAEWLRSEVGAHAAGLSIEGVQGPVVLGLVRDKGGVDYHRVLVVTARSAAPTAGLWSVYVDQNTGLPVARYQRLMFSDATVQINAPERWPGGTRRAFPATRMSVALSAGTLVADAAGLLTWTSTETLQATLRAQGPLVKVINNASRTQTSTAVALTPSETFVWDRHAVEIEDAQLVTYVAAHTVKARAKIIAPEMRWLDTNQLQANVNINDVCNAYSDGDTINFYKSGQGCENTGRLPDVIYHEFGHAFHFHAIIDGVGQFESNLSEGAGDYLSATTTGDHGMGRGFFFNDEPLRDIDPAGREAVWPTDISQDPHETGLIFAGTMWDLRKAYVETYGEDDGIKKADRLYFQILQRAVDIPSTYAEALAADDDDGDLSNGTPNTCAINEAFGRHGLADPTKSGPGIGSPTESGLTITVPVHPTNTCPGSAVTSVRLDWSLRATPSINGRMDMTPSDAAGGYVGTIPAQHTGEVVRYKVTVTLSSGETFALPDNKADPMYELFVGEVTPIYCTGFEGDPAAEGWTHALTAGQATQGADDWMFGAPQGTAGSGDPSKAFEGNDVAGNDLGGGNFNGLYQSNKTNVLVSPLIDTSSVTNVRLQYRRWLTVEDGFYDHARIYANDAVVWSNKASDDQGLFPHLDREWRFQDVDLTSHVQDGHVQVKFQIQSDGGLEFGGWNIDDFCIVTVTPPRPVCGNGVLEAGEACDDGNTTSGDGCEASCQLTPPAVCGNGVVERGEACDDGNTTNGDGCEASCTLTPAPVCGNGVVEAGEACDDGKLDGTACATGCKLPPAANLAQSSSQGCSCRTENSRKSGAPLFAVMLLGALVASLRLRPRRKAR